MLDIAIELRKYAGTRTGRAVLTVIGGLAVVLAVVGAVVIDGEPLAVSRALSYPMTALEIGLPVVVVLLFTSEWSTRDVVQSFVLRPRRGTVLRSKCIAAVIIVAAGLALGLVTTVVAVGIRSVATDTPMSLAGVAGREGAMTGSVLTAALYAAFATGIGLLVARTALALVIYLGVITVVETTLALFLGDRSIWVSLGQAVGKVNTADVHAADLPSLATSLGLWIVAPLAVGWAAFMRREAR